MDEDDKLLHRAFINNLIEGLKPTEAYERILLCIKTKWFDPKYPNKSPEEIQNIWDPIVVDERTPKEKIAWDEKCECGDEDWIFDAPAHQYVCKSCGITAYAHDKKTKEFIIFNAPLEAGTFLSDTDYKGKKVEKQSWAKNIKINKTVKQTKKLDARWNRINKEVGEALGVLYINIYGVTMDGPYMTQLYSIWTLISNYIIDQGEAEPTAGNSRALQILILEKLFALDGKININRISLRTIEPYEGEKVSYNNMNRMSKFFKEATDNIPELLAFKEKTKNASKEDAVRCLSKGLDESDLDYITSIENSIIKIQKTTGNMLYNKFIAISYYLIIHDSKAGKRVLKTNIKPTIRDIYKLCPIEEISYRDLRRKLALLKLYYERRKNKSL